MSLKNCSTNLIMLTTLLMVSKSAIASVSEVNCGKYTYIVEIRGFGLYETKYDLYYKIENQPKKLFYSTKKGVVLDAACIQNNEKQDLMLFLEFGGGNVGPEDRYGIFNPRTKKMLIQPTSWYTGNSKQVEKIIGHPPPFPVYEDKDGNFFCCINNR